MLSRCVVLISVTASLAACERDTAPPKVVADPAPVTEMSPTAVSTLMESDPSAVIVDVNPRGVYDEAHIPGAAWMSSSDVDFDKLPDDRTVPIVFYCYNEMCGASHQAATATVERGWRNVARMPAGIVGWKAAGLPVEPPRNTGAVRSDGAAPSASQESPMKLITREDLIARLESDHPPVRLEALAAPQYQSGHLPGAQWFPVEQARKLAATVVPSKETPVVVYCASETCRNSHVAAKALVDLGYTDVAVYAGGKADWQNAGLPLERTPGIETTAQAVGCTLDTGGLLQRTAEFESLFRRALLRRDATTAKATWTFTWSQEVEREVRALAASESSCCSFFRFDIARDGDELRWTVTAPPSKADAIQMLDQLAVAAQRL